MIPAIDVPASSASGTSCSNGRSRKLPSSLDFTTSQEDDDEEESQPDEDETDREFKGVDNEEQNNAARNEIDEALMQSKLNAQAERLRKSLNFYRRRRSSPRVPFERYEERRASHQLELYADGYLDDTHLDNGADGDEDDEERDDTLSPDLLDRCNTMNRLASLIEKTIIIHRDEDGFGLRLRGQTPVQVEHVHENGAAWRAGVRAGDHVSKVNGVPVGTMEHRDVVLMFKSCTRIVALGLLSCGPFNQRLSHRSARSSHKPASIFSAAQRRASRPASMIHKLSSCTDQQAVDIGLRNSRLGSFGSQLSQPNKLSHHEPSCQYHDNPAIDRQLVGKLAGYREPTIQINSGGSPELTGAGLTRFQQVSSPGRQQQHLSPYWPSTGQTSGTSEANRTCSFGFQLDVNKVRPASACNEASNMASSQSGVISGSNMQSLLDERSSGFHLLPRAHHSSMRDPTVQGTNRQAQQPIEVRVSNLADYAYPQHHPMRLSLSANNLCSPGQANMAIPLNQQQEKPQTPQPQQLQPSKPATNKRLETIKEFIDTERAHTDRLRCLDELFYRPLKSGGLMSAEQLRQVFSCHRTLYKIHRSIYRTLLSASHNQLYSEPLIGSALLEIFEGDLKRRLERAACTFCSAQSINIELLNKLTRRDTKVGEFIAQVSSQQMVGRLGIKDLLASCFQRLTKYPLLLQSLLKSTPLPESIFPSSPESIQSVVSEQLSIESGRSNSSNNQSAHLWAPMDQNSRRMLAMALAEEREFIGQALQQSRQILVKVNESVKIAMSHNKLKEIWKRTDKYPGVPLVDISKQQIVHEGQLTLRLSKRCFDVHVLLLTDYLIILSREGQDKYRLKFFNPDSKSLSASSQGTVYSPVFVVDEHLSTRDAATDENGFYLLCKRKEDCRIYEFASRSPAERIKWRDSIQWSIERQMSRTNCRRTSCESNITKSSSEISTKLDSEEVADEIQVKEQLQKPLDQKSESAPAKPSSNEKQTKDELSKIEGTISYVEDDGIVMPTKMESPQVQVNQAIRVSNLGSIGETISLPYRI